MKTWSKSWNEIILLCCWHICILAKWELGYLLSLERKILFSNFSCMFLIQNKLKQAFYYLGFQKFFLINRTIFSHRRSEQFWQQNTISSQISFLLDTFKSSAIFLCLLENNHLVIIYLFQMILKVLKIYLSKNYCCFNFNPF